MTQFRPDNTEVALLNRILPPLAAAVIAATPALAQDTEIQFALDWRFEGPSAPYFLAIDNGYFAEQGLSVEVTAGQGSLDAIPKVASGAFPMGFADINSLMRFLDQNPGAPVTAVMMVYDSPPFAIVGRVSQGISGIEDLEGSVLGAPPPDGAWAQFPILAAVNDIDVSTITVEEVGFPTREPMLAEGNVDASPASTSPPTCRSRGSASRRTTSPRSCSPTMAWRFTATRSSSTPTSPPRTPTP
jgi:NitT/TauT family transport system substrate-binding protein